MAKHSHRAPFCIGDQTIVHRKQVKLYETWVTKHINEMYIFFKSVKYFWLGVSISISSFIWLKTDDTQKQAELFSCIWCNNWMCWQMIMTNIIKQPWIEHEIYWIINKEMIRYIVGSKNAKDLVKWMKNELLVKSLYCTWMVRCQPF